MTRRATVLLAFTILVINILHTGTIVAQGGSTPTATLVPDADTRFSGAVDSNTPLVWTLLNGRRQLVALTSINGQPSWASGRNVLRLGTPVPVSIDPWPGEGVWMEAIVPAADGTLYGFYHNERVATACGDATTKVAPRIGAARSSDGGATWTDLGVLLEAPVSSFQCDTPNEYFVGGVGDLDAMLDADGNFLYLYFSEYGRDISQQGVAVARLAWADRDAPVGKLDLWNNEAWLPSDDTSPGAASPIFPTTYAWHDADGVVDAFWGPSIHWNEYLRQYVMLLNRAKDEAFSQEGIYIAFGSRLDDPASWSAPAKLFDGGVWYPQVVGTESGLGTDKFAGETARFYMGGDSRYMIRFSR